MSPRSSVHAVSIVILRLSRTEVVRHDICAKSGEDITAFIAILLVDIIQMSAISASDGPCTALFDTLRGDKRGTARDVEENS